MHVGESIYGATAASQLVRCNLCCAFCVVQSMWCNQSLAQLETVLCTARANIPPSHPQLGRKTS
eukprot:2340788-Pyramimonas_sp.AAC.1